MFPQLLVFVADQPTLKVMISSLGGPEVEKCAGVSGGGGGVQWTSHVINSLTKRAGQMGDCGSQWGLDWPLSLPLVQEPCHKSPALIAPVYYL